jgi:hypothetical protein
MNVQPAAVSALLQLSHTAELRSRLWERLSRFFLQECISLCDENVRQNWGNPGSPFSWSVRDVSHLKLVCLADDMRVRNILPGLSTADTPVRELTAPALGLRDPPDCLSRTLRMLGYGVPSDFVVELLVAVNDHRRIGSNVILCGETVIDRVEASG